MSSAKVVGVISIKGGVGKTTTVSNLGAVLATEFNKRILIVDGNFSAPNLGLHLGLVNPEHTLHDVLKDKIHVSDAIYEYTENLHILPSSLVSNKINPFKLKSALKDLKAHYDFILIDSSPNLNEEILATMVAADELMVVTSPDYPTLSMTMRAVKVAKEKKTPISGLILNRVRDKKYELSVDDIEDATSTPVLAKLPEDYSIHEAIAQTKPNCIHNFKSNVNYEFRKLAASLIGEEYEDTRFKTKIKRLFNKTPDKTELNRLHYAQGL